MHPLTVTVWLLTKVRLCITYISHVPDIDCVRSACCLHKTHESSLVCQLCINLCMCARSTACDLGSAVDSWKSSEETFETLFTGRHFALTHVLVALSCQ